MLILLLSDRHRNIRQSPPQTPASIRLVRERASFFVDINLLEILYHYDGNKKGAKYEN